jgi:hypothetical protein
VLKFGSALPEPAGEEISVTLACFAASADLDSLESGVDDLHCAIKTSKAAPSNKTPILFICRMPFKIALSIDITTREVTIGV